MSPPPMAVNLKVSADSTLWGYQKSASPVSCGDAPETRWARIHDRGGDLLSCCRCVGLSGRDQVLVREAAKDLFSADPVLREVDLRWPGASLSRCELAKGTVWPGC